MQQVKAAWKSGLVLVCGNERPKESGKVSCGLERGSELRRWLKDRIRAEGLDDEILSVRTGCLGICSPLGVTVELVSATRGAKATLVVEPEKDREALWEIVRRELLPPPKCSSQKEV